MSTVEKVTKEVWNRVREVEKSLICDHDQKPIDTDKDYFHLVRKNGSRMKGVDKVFDFHSILCLESFIREYKVL